MTEETGSELSVQDQPVTYQTLKFLSKSPTVPEHYRNRPRDMLAVALQGREIGVGPMTAVNNMEVIDGTISMRAKLYSALIHGAGHIIKILEQSGETAKLECYRYHPQLNELINVGIVEYTIDDATAAGDAKKGTYKKHAKAMLTNRAMTLAGRTFYGDCLAGIGYTPAELDKSLTEDDIAVELVKEELDGIEVTDDTIEAEIVEDDTDE